MARNVATLEFHNRLLTFQLFTDALVAFAGLAIGYFVRFDTPIRQIGKQVSEGPGLVNYLPLMLFGALLLVFSFAFLGLYNWRNFLRLRRTLPIIFKGTIFWFFVFVFFSLFLKFDPAISRIYAACCLLTCLGVMTLWRVGLYRVISKIDWKIRLNQRVAILGWNDEASKLADQVHKDETHPYEIAGVIMSTVQSETNTRCLFPVLGDMHDLEHILRENEIDILINTDLDLQRSELINVVHTCERSYVDLKLNPSIFQIFVSNLYLETVSGVPVIGLETPRINKIWHQMGKRIVDICGGLFGLIIFAPAIAAFAYLIKKQDSAGPVFFKQTRIGKNGMPFTIYKLGSMKVNAEAETGAVWAIKDDPRRLPIGRFMREWNIDELPQFWNVLKGDMSLVGPRPERPELIEKFEREIDHYNPRHTVKPGMTGWAQVNGLRGDTSLTERIRYDLYYIENWSLYFDFQIMVMTFFTRDNAY